MSLLTLQKSGYSCLRNASCSFGRKPALFSLIRLLCCSIVSCLARECMSRFVEMSWLCTPSCRVTCHILSTPICRAMSRYLHPVRFILLFRATAVDLDDLARSHATIIFPFLKSELKIEREYLSLRFQLKSC